MSVILKCKMCGGTLDVQEGMTVCECEYCGSKQTIPNLDDEKKIKLYERANKLRFNNEFDKAYSVYQDIANDYSDDAEAYWGLLLCKYGIEYVEDPATHNRIPTCHRSSFESIMDDSDFEMVMENADSISRSLYREEAKKIEEIRKGIIEVSSKEEPYDIFICYKETAEDGQRTIDSVLAQDVYTELTNKGYKVFFSRITLEDKLGQEYEPYIFAALNSAKIMLAFGTSYDYYNAVWVKNEWSRYLQLMAKDSSKHLIPCYKNIDAYDMPKEFAKLQAQDLGKVGATQDLLRGIEKILPINKESETKTQTTTIIQQTAGPNVDSLLKRGYMALEDEEWETAKKYFNDVLDMNAECGEAYLGQALSTCEWKNFEELQNAYLHPKYDDQRFDFNDLDSFKSSRDVTFIKLLNRARQFSNNIDLQIKKLTSDRVNMEKLMNDYLQLQNKLSSSKLNYLNETQSKKLEDFNKELLNLEQEHKSQIENLTLRVFNKYEGEIEEINNSINVAEKKRQEFVNQREKLNIFNNKKKKELDSLIIDLDNSIKEFKDNLQLKTNERTSELSEKTEMVNKELKEKNDSVNKNIEKLYEEAKPQLETLKENIRNEIKDVARQLKEFGLLKIEKHNIGETIKFDKGNNEWIVLDEQDDKILILRKRLSGLKKFDDKFVAKTNDWNKSQIKEYLNSKFIDFWFFKEDQLQIVENSPNGKVFLLSVEEAKKYFNSDDERVCYFNKDNVGLVVEPWWLRTATNDSSVDEFAFVAWVNSEGRIVERGTFSHKELGVRPAMWISII